MLKGHLVNGCYASHISRPETKRYEYIRGEKKWFQTQTFAPEQGIYKGITLCNKMGGGLKHGLSKGKSTLPLHIEGRQRMLYFNIQRTETFSMAMR